MNFLRMPTNKPYINMKKLIPILIVALAIGCKHGTMPAGPQASVINVAKPDRPQVIYNHEVLCYGSTAGILPYFYSLLRAQNFDDAVKITDPASVRRHGKDRVMAFYKKIDISYTPKLLSIVRYGGDSARLRYKVRRFATSRFIDITTVTRDSVKVVLPNTLADFLK